MVRVRITLETSQGSEAVIFDEDVDSLDEAAKAYRVLSCAVLLDRALREFWSEETP